MRLVSVIMMAHVFVRGEKEFFECQVYCAARALFPGPRVVSCYLNSYSELCGCVIRRAAAGARAVARQIYCASLLHLPRSAVRTPFQKLSYKSLATGSGTRVVKSQLRAVRVRGA